MPCRILIKENVENFVDKYSQRGLSMSLQDANMLASNINAKMKHHVVSFYNDGGKVGRTINIPDELVDKYFDIEVKRRTPITTDITIPVKEGVEELFDSTPELANQVYETLEFNKALDIKLVYQNLKANEGDVLKWQYSENIDGDIYNFDLSLSRIIKDTGAIETYLDIDFDVNGSEDIINRNLYQRKERIQQIIENLLAKGNKYSYDWLRFDSSIEQGLKKAVQRTNLYERVLKELGYTIENRSEDQRTLFLKQPVYNPKNINITPQQKQQAQIKYSQYLNTIFPDSKMKDIVYHGSQKNIDSFYDSTKGIYFSGISDYWENNKFVYAAILDMTSPKYGETSYIAQGYLNENQDSAIKTSEYESVNWQNLFNETKNDNSEIGRKNHSLAKRRLEQVTRTNIFEAVVFKKEQIHILGNKQDIEGFKNFVDSRPVAPANKFELDIKNLNLTPEVVNYLYQDSRAKSQGRDIESYKREISKLINNLQSDFTNSEILETLKCI
jgi:hypothetical protein